MRNEVRFEDSSILTFSQFKAAQYLRLAEEKGSRQVGNAWYVTMSHCPFPSRVCMLFPGDMLSNDLQWLHLATTRTTPIPQISKHKNRIQSPQNQPLKHGQYPATISHHHIGPSSQVAKNSSIGYYTLTLPSARPPIPFLWDPAKKKSWLQSS